MVSLEGGCWKSALSSNSPAAYPTARRVLRGGDDGNIISLPDDWNYASVPATRRHTVVRPQQRTHMSPLEPSTDSFLIASPLLAKSLFQLFFFSPNQQVHDGNMEGGDEKCGG